MRPSLMAIAIGLTAAGCDGPSEPAQRPLELERLAGSYSVVYDPPRLLETANGCDRLLTHAVLSFSARLFDLSINAMDDCSQSGGQFYFWEVLFLGFVSVQDDTLIAFTPEPGYSPTEGPTFTGTVDGEYVIVEVPAGIDSLASAAVTLKVGPRHPH